MPVPVVWSVREVRERISVAIDLASRGKVVFVGAYRQAEVALISIDRYRELTRGERTGDPLDPDDTEAHRAPAPEEEVLCARALARHEISYHEYALRMRNMYERQQTGAAPSDARPNGLRPNGLRPNGRRPNGVDWAGI